MTQLEQKNIETQLQLLREIKEDDLMIIHCIRSEGGSLLESIKDKCFFKEGQTTVELTEKEFTDIRVFLARLSHNASKTEFGKINRNMVAGYLSEKETKSRILGMLS